MSVRVRCAGGYAQAENLRIPCIMPLTLRNFNTDRRITCCRRSVRPSIRLSVTLVSNLEGSYATALVARSRHAEISRCADVGIRRSASAKPHTTYIHLVL